MAAKAYPSGPRYGFPANAKGFLYPPIVWAFYFVVIYSAQGAGCASAFEEVELFGTDLLRLSLLLIMIVSVGAIAGVGVWAFRAWRRIRSETGSDTGSATLQSDFLAFGALLNAGLFVIATLWTGLPAVLVDPCR